VETSGLQATGTTGWRARNGIPQKAFLASYSGNLGRKQGLEVLLDAAEILAFRENGEDAVHIPVAGGSEGSPNVAQASQPAFPSTGRIVQGSMPVVLVIAGDGAMRPTLEARLQKRPLSNVRLLPLLSDADYHAMLAESDVCLITQSKGTGRFFLPSKLLSIVAASRPVVAMADETSELARAVREGSFGVVVPSEDADGLARTLRGLATAPGDLAQYGSNGASWVNRFEANSVLDRFESRLLADRPPH
jgi:colanic acid biosynthesis glycosyl transferase WcaI